MLVEGMEMIEIGKETETEREYGGINNCLSRQFFFFSLPPHEQIGSLYGNWVH